VLLLPTSVGCASSNASTPQAAAPRADELPRVRPENWDPLAFNRARGNAGAIPEEYRAKINGPDGDRQHLGKHLPYTPSQVQAPAGMLAVMWGDSSRGYAKHPNARRSAELPTGHWFDWIRVRRATHEDAEERESRFTDWPATAPSDNGRLSAIPGSTPERDDGKDTVYLVELPTGVRPGEWVRVHGHCLTHGEYVEFLRVPA